MERKLDQALVEQYSEEFTEKVLLSAFADTKRLDGQAILNLSPVKQINLLVIKALFDQWQREIDKLRSPYFDYESEEVQQALDNFINTLSQNISVDRNNLQPLVERAVQDTLYLVFNPTSYYQQQVSAIPDEGIRQEGVLTWLKYIKINRSLLELYINKIQQQSSPVLDSDTATHLLDETIKEFSDPLEETSPHVTAFSEIYSFEPEQLMADDAPAHSEEEPTLEPEENKSEEEVTSTDFRTLHDHLSQQSPANTTLTNIQKKHKTESIREQIGVNQRYMFIRELFGNDPQEYQQAIYELDQKQSYVEAFNFLRHEFAQKHHWKMDSEEVVELLEIVSKRYN